MTPDELAQLEARILAEVNARVADADARMQALRVESIERVEQMTREAFDRLFAGLPPELRPQTKPPATLPPETPPPETPPPETPPPGGAAHESPLEP